MDQTTDAKILFNVCADLQPHNRAFRGRLRGLGYRHQLAFDQRHDQTPCSRHSFRIAPTHLSRDQYRKPGRPLLLGYLAITIPAIVLLHI